MITFKEKPNYENELKELLHPIVRKWFFSRFKEFSLPQKFAVMEIHSRKNVLVSAPTGATKTLTAFLSILNELVDSASKGILEGKIYAIYISPLKALNYDIEQNLLKPLREMEDIHGVSLGIRIGVRTGDTTQSERSKMLKKPPHILITTPESVAMLLSSQKFRDHLRDVAWVVVDEIHALADNKRGTHLSLSLERLEYLSKHLTRVGLSATVAPLEEVAKYLVGKRDCIIVNVQYIKETDIKVMSPVNDLVNITHSEMHRKLYSLIHDLIQKHTTTLIFTNTRSATERIVYYMKEMFPRDYNDENIGAHHGSLDREHRRKLEKNLREGKLKCVVCSTSLELGIDIGYIDLVICLGSPKSVARALQRIGRSGHKLHETTKGRIIVLDRDDLVECALLVKAAVEKKIDRIHIPRDALDVLVQHIYGMALENVWDEKELYEIITKSYCYHELKWHDYQEVLSYLAGEYSSLEDRHVYAKIWRKDGKIGRRGKLARVIYMTNIGTIPEQSSVIVKVGNKIVGSIDEAFLERLKRGDVFVLGGSVYEFLYSRGMVAYVNASVERPPTVPSWFSEMLPLSFDLAHEISRFRRLMFEKFDKGKDEKEILKFINDYLYIDKNGAQSIYNYFWEQYYYVKVIPHDKLIVIEDYKGEEYNHNNGRKFIFHTLYGRRVNDVLSRAIAYAISRTQHRDVEIGINDNGFYVASDKKIDVAKALKLLRANELREVLEKAIERTEVFKRRFRHCAMRSLMILRTYKGRTKNVGRQQVSSMIMLNAARRINEEFFVIKEAKREVLEDLMDIENAVKVLKDIEDSKIKVKEINTLIPSPFAFNIVIQGYSDILKIDDKMDFLKRMHELIKAKIALEEGKKLKKKKTGSELKKALNYNEIWEEEEKKKEQELMLKTEMKDQLEWVVKRKELDNEFAQWLDDLIEGKINLEKSDDKTKTKIKHDRITKKFIAKIKKEKEIIKNEWPPELVEYVFNSIGIN